MTTVITTRAPLEAVPIGRMVSTCEPFEEDRTCFARFPDALASGPGVWVDREGSCFEVDELVALSPLMLVGDAAPDLLPMGLFSEWLRNGQRGSSSETIVGHLTGVPITQRPGVPRDPSDFRRCELLLRAVPEARIAFDQMRTAGPTWGRLVDHWDEIVATSEQECPGEFDSARPSGRTAPETAALIRSLVSQPNPEGVRR